MSKKRANKEHLKEEPSHKNLKKQHETTPILIATYSNNQKALLTTASQQHQLHQQQQQEQQQQQSDLPTTMMQPQLRTCDSLNMPQFVKPTSVQVRDYLERNNIRPSTPICLAPVNETIPQAPPPNPTPPPPPHIERSAAALKMNLSQNTILSMKTMTNQRKLHACIESLLYANKLIMNLFAEKISSSEMVFILREMLQHHHEIKEYMDNYINLFSKDDFIWGA
jgi:uncharacterized membrane protein YkoI